MKKYIAPEIEIVKLENCDIIAASPLSISEDPTDTYQSREGFDWIY